MSRPPLHLPAGADASPGGSNWANTPERSNMLVLRFFSWLALSCGRRVARLVLHPVVLYFFLFRRGRAAASSATSSAPSARIG